MSSNDTEYLKKAERIARSAHEGQTRRDGTTPYIVHPEAVANRLEDEEEKAIAWLHDVLEDTFLSEEDLLNMGIKQSHIDALILLTKKKGQSNIEYWDAIKTNELARKVKIADMWANLFDDPTDYQSTKYMRGIAHLDGWTHIKLEKLEDKIGEME